MSSTKTTCGGSADSMAKRRFRSLKAASSPKALDCDEQASASTASRKWRAQKDPGDCKAMPVALVVSIDEASDSEDGSQNALKAERILDTRRQDERDVFPCKAGERPEFSGQIVVGGVPLSWSVVKPSAGSNSCASEKPPARKPRQQVNKASSNMQHLRLKNADEISTHREAISSVARLRERAQKLLFEALGSDEKCEEISIAIVNAFLKLHELSVARRLLLDFNSALRRNPQLKSEVISSGPLGVVNLAHQDPREWATDELVAKRRRWTEESIQEIKPAAPAAVCPVCGGRAVIATGTAGSGRSGRLTKAFAHYSCLEDHCGKSSHVKQD